MMSLIILWTTYRGHRGGNCCATKSQNFPEHVENGLLYTKKEILIFDESTSNLDNKNKEKFIYTINQLAKEKTIIIISHDENVIKNCKKKYIVKEKKLIKIN